MPAVITIVVSLSSAQVHRELLLREVGDLGHAIKAARERKTEEEEEKEESQRQSIHAAQAAAPLAGMAAPCPSSSSVHTPPSQGLRAPWQGLVPVTHSSEMMEPVGTPILLSAGGGSIPLSMARSSVLLPHVPEDVPMDTESMWTPFGDDGNGAGTNNAHRDGLANPGSGGASVHVPALSLRSTRSFQTSFVGTRWVRMRTIDAGWGRYLFRPCFHATPS